MHRRSRIAGYLYPLVAASMLAGCASYRPLPLDDQPAPPRSVAEIRIDTAKLAFPVLRAHRFDPADGLDMTEVAMLAVANNPALKLARDDAGISRAQAFAAHVLPDPQFSLSRDYPHGGPPGTTTAFNAGLAYDLNALVSHAAGADAAEAEARKTNLNLLWQEWQAVAQARLLFSQIVNEDRQYDWLAATRDLLASRYRQASRALAEGEIAADVANASLVAWQDAARQVDDLTRQRLKARHELNALLGLPAGTVLALVDDQRLALPDQAEIEADLAVLPARRPDLLALKAGYAAEDARYRQAILAQFPPLNLALTRARDTGGLFTRGFALSMALPLLNGNRGNIRIEQATRRRLHDEYQQRLDAARNEIERVVADRRLLAGQLETAQAALPSLDRAARNAGEALKAGDLDWPGYAAFESARIAKHIEVANLRQALLEGNIALLSLLGGEFTQTHAATEKQP